MTEQPYSIGALFDDEHTHRFRLWRIWNRSKPLAMFIGLNPSTANEETSDPTIRRITSFTNSFGYGGFYMINLFPFITAYPHLLQHTKIDENDIHLKQVADLCRDVVLCWGSGGYQKYFKGRDKEVIKMFPDAYCFGKTSLGYPKHPLYLAKYTQLNIFNQ